MQQKVLMIIAPQNFRDEELFVPKEILEKNNFKVEIASTTQKEATGMLGKKITPNLTIDKITINDYKAIIFVGGSGVEQNKLYENEKILNIAKTAAQKGKIIAAICVAPRILAKASILKNVKCTVFGDQKSILMLKQANAKYSGEPVEVDGKIITADGPSSAEEFAEKIVELLK